MEKQDSDDDMMGDGNLSDNNDASINEGEDDEESSSGDDCDGDPEIKHFRNPVTVNFLQYLLKKFQSRSYQVSGGQKIAKPQEILGHKMVHLKKGFSLKIYKGGRNVLIVDSKSHKNPSLFTRKTLVQVFGGSQLGNLTAKGRKKGSIRIADNDLAAIYAFVVEYCKPKEFTWEQFLRAVTKKCASAKTPTSTPKSSKKVLEESTEPPSTPTKEVQFEEDKVVASPSKFQKSLTVVKTSTVETNSVSEWNSSQANRKVDSSNTQLNSMAPPTASSSYKQKAPPSYQQQAQSPYQHQAPPSYHHQSPSPSPSYQHQASTFHQSGPYFYQQAPYNAEYTPQISHYQSNSAWGHQSWTPGYQQ